ncbi:unnamed protein product [Nesidiocoris tenuis]|uniref:Uncharacterized protein n=1 Tax=Nesidiocoris tenuis TaxID=355587 RepID=A0A6H5G2F8_9HEMI|nr:unnamed protein product [Nesidiocoris tenuis]
MSELHTFRRYTLRFYEFQCALRDHLAYCASKSAVDMMSKVMALELGAHGIRVNCVNPTVVLTAMGRLGWSDPAKAGPLLQRIPLNRFAEVHDSLARYKLHGVPCIFQKRCYANAVQIRGYGFHIAESTKHGRRLMATDHTNTMASGLWSPRRTRKRDDSGDNRQINDEPKHEPEIPSREEPAGSLALVSQMPIKKSGTLANNALFQIPSVCSVPDWSIKEEGRGKVEKTTSLVCSREQCSLAIRVQLAESTMYLLQVHEEGLTAETAKQLSSETSDHAHVKSSRLGRVVLRARRTAGPLVEEHVSDRKKDGCSCSQQSEGHGQLKQQQFGREEERQFEQQRAQEAGQNRLQQSRPASVAARGTNCNRMGGGSFLEKIMQIEYFFNFQDFTIYLLGLYFTYV